MKLKDTNRPVNIDGKLYRALTRRYVDPVTVKEQIFQRYQRGDLRATMRDGEVHLTEVPKELRRR